MSATRLQCLLRTNKNDNRFPRSEKNLSFLFTSVFTELMLLQAAIETDPL